ncbi:MAG: YgiT-type zinc finger protein [Alphaproteobacteria bacterium]|nr:YgiT-type zinc finger protein [Alphaproteobacteria bacterium]
MRCEVCKEWAVGAGRTTVTLQRGGTTVTFHDVPTRVCRACGDASLEGRIALHLMTMADRKAGHHVAPLRRQSTG